MTARAENITRHTASPTALAVAAERPNLKAAVIANAHCDDAMWLSLYNIKGPHKLTVAQAKAAVHTCTTPERVSHLLAVETRGSVVKELLVGPDAGWPLIGDDQFAPFLTDTSVGKRLASRGAGPAFADRWAARPAESLYRSLRSWRLVSPLLDDDEVLAEIVSYDSWGDAFAQVPLGFAFVTHRHLYGRIAEVNTSAVVRTQIAGSVFLGSLSRDAQLVAVGLGSLPAAGPDRDVYREAHVYAWMSAAGNPTTHPDVRQQLTEQLAYTEKGATYRPAARYVPEWGIRDISDVHDSAQLDLVVKWVSRRGKLPALLLLAQNPHLTRDQAHLLGGCLDAEHGLRLAAPAVFEALEILEQRFPGLTLTQLHRDLVAQASDLCAHPDGIGHEPPGPLPEEVPDRSNWALRCLADEYSALACVPWLDLQIGEDADAWAMVFDLADTLEDSSLEDLATIALSI